MQTLESDETQNLLIENDDDFIDDTNNFIVNRTYGDHCHLQFIHKQEVKVLLFLVKI